MTISFETGIDYAYTVTGDHGAPVFSPLALPGYLDWWEPAGTDGAPMVVWPGMPGSATNDLANANPFNPLYATFRQAGLDYGQPAGQFVTNSAGDGGAAYTDGTLLAGATAATVCFSFEVPSTGTLPGTQMTLLGRELSWKVTVEANLSLKLLVSSNGSSWTINTASAANTVVRGTTYVATFLLGGGTADLRLQETNLISGTFTAALATSSSNPFRIAGNNENGAYPLVGLVGRTIVCNQRLSGATLDQLENFVLGGVA